MIRRSTIFILLVAICGCEDVVDRPVNAGERRLVVEGVITNERTNHLIRLTLTSASQNAAPVPASGAVVRLQGGDEMAELIEFPSGSGHYYTPQFRAITNRTYSLLIMYEGNQYTATDRGVAVEQFRPLRYSRQGDGFQLNFQQQGNTPYYIDHYLTWKHTPSCQQEICEGKVVFYDLKNLDVNEIFKPENERFTFPLHTVVVRRKFSVSPAYQAFLRSMLSETQWRGGVFDVQRANAATNVSGGALGFFAVSTVISDTTVIQRSP